MFFAFGSDRKRIRTHYLPTVSVSKDKSRLVQPYRLVFNCFEILEKVYFHVYRLEEDGDLWKKVVSGFRFSVKSLLL